jgi:hypothetical protein
MPKYLLTNLLVLFSLFANAQGSGNALVFDGTNNNIEITSTFPNQNGTSSFSFCAWVMTTNAGKAGQRIVCDDQQTSGSGGYALSLGDPGSGRLRFYCRALSAVSLDVSNANYYLSNNIWYHVAATYNVTTRVRNIYVNGELAATATHTAGEWTTAEVDNGPVTIGGESNGSSESGNRFQGQIDEVSYWSKSLSQTEIRDLMCKSLVGTESNLIGYWTLNTAALGANGVPDATSNSYHGTMQNMVAGEIVTSAAPIGISSVYTYTTSWSGVNLFHVSPEGDSLQVSSVSSATVNAVHIYHVTSVPNTTSGITGYGGNDHYFGVFKSVLAGGSGTYTARYYYRQNDAYQASSTVDPDYDENNLRVFTRSDNAATPWTMNAAVPTTSSKTIALTAMSTEFMLGYLNSTAALPIELLFFEALAHNNSTLLDWCTASEINNHYFTIERSQNGSHFESIVQIPGAGNSNQNLCYSANDLQPYQGINYYRLKQTDYNGASTYSQVVTVFFSEKNTVLLYPNPANELIYIHSSGSNPLQVEICDAQGKLLVQTSLQQNQAEINVSGLYPGIYFMRAFDGNEWTNLSFIRE